MRRSTLILIAGGLASVAVAASAFLLYGRPSYVKIAVTRDSSDHHLLMAAAQVLTRERASVRFRLVPVNDPAAASKALDTGNAEFSVSRSDTGMPSSGKTTVVMHNNLAVIVKPAGSGEANLRALQGKTFGLLDDHFRNSNRALLEQIFTHYGLPLADLKIKFLRIDEITPAVRTGAIDALFMAGPLAGGKTGDAINAFASAAQPAFVAIDHAQAISQFSNIFEKATIVAGAFGGKSPRPASDVETIGVSVRLFAANSLSNQLVSDVTRTMFELRPKLAPAIPLALQIQAPETTRDSRMPAHPGAIAYLDNEEVSLYDRFSNLFYLSAMVLSLLGSLAAAIATQFGAGEKQAHAQKLKRLSEILPQVRRAVSHDELDDFQTETDIIMTNLALNAENAKASQPGVETFGLFISQIHIAIKDRREQLLLLSQQEAASSLHALAEAGKAGGSQIRKAGV